MQSHSGCVSAFEWRKLDMVFMSNLMWQKSSGKNAASHLPPAQLSSRVHAEVRVCVLASLLLL